jgi:hypothetical protein
VSHEDGKKYQFQVHVGYHKTYVKPESEINPSGFDVQFRTANILKLCPICHRSVRIIYPTVNIPNNLSTEKIHFHADLKSNEFFV